MNFWTGHTVNNIPNNRFSNLFAVKYKVVPPALDGA